MKPVQLLEWMFKLVRLLFASALFLAFLPPSRGIAQASNNPWAAPLNLSHSGFAMNPAIVTDSEGIVHVIWQDDLAKYVYSRFDGEQWSAPEITNLDVLFRLPISRENQSGLSIYTGPNPLFVAGPGPNLFAFWISPQGKLFTSKVRNQNFNLVGAWDGPGLITPSVASFAVAIDARGEWHLAYVRSIGDPRSPAGIYYVRSNNGGWNWTVPMLLYTSPYLHTLSEGEANVSIATAGTDDAQHVYVAWDNRPRKQVLLSQSTDGGKSWEQPAVVAGPGPDTGLAGPFDIQVGTYQNDVMLIWQNSRATNGLLPGCSQIYQSSSDAGTTWSEPQPMIENMLGCAQSNKFLIGQDSKLDSPLYLMTKTKSQIFLTAWNGHKWSLQQEQSVLSGFQEPEIYTEVTLGCHQASLLGARLYVVGCDQGEGGDIWVTSRELESDMSWFQPPVWSAISPVANDNLKMEAVDLVATEDGSFHVFLSQHQNRSIYYTYWDGEFWSRLTPVLELPDGKAISPVVAAGPRNELFLVTQSDKGTLYFSRATSGNAATRSHWSKPARLRTANDGEIGAVDISADTSGTVYVVYSVPVNEERGIYLIQSKDQGTSWSEPLRIFNGATAGFDLVGAPSLLTAPNGVLHVLWKEQVIQGDGNPQPLSLYYARSEDGGHTFSDSTQVVKESVAWREMATDGKGNLHILWQPQDTLTTVWDQVSLDGGHTWQYPQGLPDDGKLASVTTDVAGRLHLVGVGLDALGHWLWNDNHWESEPPLNRPLSSQPMRPVRLLATAINKQGKMMVVMAEPAAEGDEAQMSLQFSTRTLEFPPRQTMVQDIPTKALVPATTTPAATATEPSLTLTASASNESASASQTHTNKTNNPISPFETALLPVALLLLSVLGIVIWQVAQVKER